MLIETWTNYPNYKLYTRTKPTYWLLGGMLHKIYMQNHTKNKPNYFLMASLRMNMN